jgi:hypothetical protein
VRESDPLAEGSDYDELYSELDDALVVEGNDDPSDPLTAAVVPYERVRFPLLAGEKYEQFAIDGFAVDDLDEDGKLDHADFRSVARVVGFEDVVVTAGAFEDCAHVETTLTVRYDLSSGVPASSKLVEDTWFAPHRGLVELAVRLTTTVAGHSSVERYAEELSAYQVGDEGFGIVPPFEVATDLVTAGSDTTWPGRPAIAFDGARYLVVTVRDGSPFADLVGVFVDTAGHAGSEFTIVSASDISFGMPAVAYGGDGYLVVYGEAGAIRGVRIDVDGDVLDPNGFAISQTGTSNFAARLGFDGVRYLVAWGHYSQPAGYDVYAARVTNAGAALGEFVVVSGAGDQILPDVVFDGGEHFVVWQDSASGTFALRGAHVSTAGTVLDPGGLDLATSAGGCYGPSVSFDGSQHLIAWTTPTSPAGDARIEARRIDVDGTPLGASFAIASATGPNADVAVAFDGTEHFVAWSVRGYGASAGIFARRVATDGTLLDGTASDSGLLVASAGTTEQEVLPALARGDAGRLLLVWVANSETIGQMKDVLGALVHPF